MLALSRLPWRWLLPAAAVLLLTGLSVFLYRGCREEQARDPLSGLPPALHQPRDTGETLPLPSVPAAPGRP
jgi:hypothetical protein